MFASIFRSMADEELLHFVDVAGSECSALVLELAKRLAQRVDEKEELRAVVADLEEDAGIRGLKRLAEVMEEDYGIFGLTRLVEQLEADVDGGRVAVPQRIEPLRSAHRQIRRTPIPRRTHRDVALELLPEVGASMPSHKLSKVLAERADTSAKVAVNITRRLVMEGVFSAQGRGAKRIIARARM
ncbi:hypothetical protein [Variovorax sp. YR216]|uniref:hypothetical protein n=1 Tax=Variovorax sp. YR216 TaxID=1882828 RepID=UPI000B86248F|nr:hypothetical protein [Variovorax sp. YR216]